MRKNQTIKNHAYIRSFTFAVHFVAGSLTLPESVSTINFLGLCFRPPNVESGFGLFSLFMLSIIKGINWAYWRSKDSS